MSIVISLYALVGELQENINDALDRFGIQKTDLTTEQLVVLGLQFIEGRITENRNWCTHVQKYDEMLRELFPWMALADIRTQRRISDRNKKKELKELLEYFTAYVLVPFEHELDYLCRKISTCPYAVMSTRRIGLYDVLISTPEDFRILDWERRREAGEFNGG